MFLLKNGTGRMYEDGIDQTQYKVLSTVSTELFTKISVDLLYEDYISTYVSNLNIFFHELTLNDMIGL